MSYKRILLILAFFVASTANMESIKADSCITDAMQKEADQLQIYSTFNESTKTYDVTVKGLTSGDIYVYNKNGGQYTFTYTNFDKDEEGNLAGLTEEELKYKKVDVDNNTITITGIPFGSYNFTIASFGNNNCYEDIRTENLNLEKYNSYADDPLCEGIDPSELEICDPWYQGNIDDETFEEKINDYKQSQIKEPEEEKEPPEEKEDIGKTIINFLVDNYITIIIAVVAIVTISLIIQVIFKRTKKPGDLV